MASFKIFRRLAELLDITSYDLPANNTPLANALAAKLSSDDADDAYAPISTTVTLEGHQVITGDKVFDVIQAYNFESLGSNTWGETATFTYGAGAASAYRTALGIPEPPQSKTATQDVVISSQAGSLADAARNDAQINPFAVDANSTYRVTIHFEYSSTTTSAGIKIGVNFPSLTGNGTQRGGVATTANGAIANFPNVVGSLFQLTSAIGGVRVQITATIIVRTGATGGVANFRWAQLNSSADPTTRHAGSSVTFEKLA